MDGGISEISNVKAMTQTFSVWLPVISTLAGGVLAGGVAILVTKLNHRYAREREEKAAEEKKRYEQKITDDKNEKELLFIATELVFHLEWFADLCVKVATDTGYEDSSGITRFSVRPEVLSLTDISGDWRVLPRQLMYRIRELPVLQNSTDRAISIAEEHDYPPDYDDTFYARRYQYTRLGLKTIILARRVRKLVGLPLDTAPWSELPVLWQLWRQERKRRTQIHILSQRALAVYQIRNQMRGGAKDPASTGVSS
ncbi:hypothetical protein J1785_06730 [Rahnella sp. SL6]|uniref:hypothetical protein n=1 Tax=Rahnella perminowiae TaxID=2816244 RepID=UPI001C2620F8|nr:hypothetical protein [Rahnella perminowiae]MBU9809438.1 hypothetical protein [Rahnella perminowiae]